MINRLLKLIRRPERGWDPIPETYAREYAEIAYRAPVAVEKFDSLLRCLEGKARPAVLDLGAGPGHNSLYFALRGCRVTWHDVSSRYLAIARRAFAEKGLECRFALGYLEEAAGTYDLVLVSQCWNYCLNDSGFARKLFSLLKPGGIVYATINNEIFFREKNVRLNTLKRYARIFQFLLNSWLNVKIGHPFPSHAKIKRVFSRLDKRHRPQECSIERSGHYTVLTMKR
ncbi:MAG: class I SAM-dependent methyltransferase [Spirochaetales bacterium]|nr:class I SAM-dependent methyltransferase [Spirochaetales bacterium]